MSSYRSSQDVVRAVQALAASLESQGHSQAADELKSGVRCLNGLTDGWALLLTSIEKVQRMTGDTVPHAEGLALASLQNEVRSVITRRR